MTTPRDGAPGSREPAPASPPTSAPPPTEATPHGHRARPPKVAELPALRHSHPHTHADGTTHAHPHSHVHEHEHDPVELGALQAPATVPAIEIRHLHHRYPDGFEALHGLDLLVRPGEKVALVGPNGAGKSTLMLHLNGILTPSDGVVLIDGLRVERASLPRIRAAVGLVFQDPDDQLFSPTVFEDVAFGPIHMGFDADEVGRRVHAALDAVGMAGFERRIPHRMSLGQRKRIALATVLSMDPAVLVFDEPSAGLDPRGRRELITLLQALPQTMLVSTHDMRLAAEIFPRTVVMDNGLIVADGPTDRILSDDELLEAHGLERP